MEPQNTLKDAEVIAMVRQIISLFVRHKSDLKGCLRHANNA